jgi:hypothetical protein
VVVILRGWEGATLREWKENHRGRDTHRGGRGRYADETEIGRQKVMESGRA